MIRNPLFLILNLYISEPWFKDVDKDCRAELNGAENLHEMTARKNRRARRKKKTQEDKVKRVKALLKPHPGKILSLIYLEENFLI